MLPTFTAITQSQRNASWNDGLIAQAYWDLMSNGGKQCKNTVQSSAIGELGEALNAATCEDLFRGTDVSVIQTAPIRIAKYKEQVDRAEAGLSFGNVKYYAPDLFLQRNGKNTRIEVKTSREELWTTQKSIKQCYVKDHNGKFTVPLTYDVFRRDPGMPYRTQFVWRTFAQMLLPEHVKRYTEDQAIVCWVVVRLNEDGLPTHYSVPGFNIMDDFAKGAFYMTGKDNIAPTCAPRPMSELVNFLGQ